MANMQAQSLQLFDETAAEFASVTDRLIASGRYRRGDFFICMARKHITPGSHILDHGCGPGRITRLLAEEGFVVHGVDPSPAMIREARRQDLKHLQVKFSVATHRNYCKASTYDAVVSSSVIEFVEDYRELLCWYHSILRPSGVLVLSYANKRSLWRAYCNLKAKDAPHRQVQHHLWDWRQCERALTKAGFHIVERPVFFESPLDRWRLASRMYQSGLIGTLGITVGKKIC